ncbi:MAG: sporulation protein YqfD [Clostridiales bacterium]|nr:sporulation protein YqfD [Clostridiales bacterium]
MLVKIIRFVLGYVDFIVCGKFPERFINLTSRNGINLWNSVPIKDGLTASMSVSDYRNIRRTAKKSRVTLKIKAKHGLPFIIKKYKPRVGIAAGTAVGIILLLVLSRFIWSIEITGNRQLSDTYLTEVLRENGVTAGAYTAGIDVEAVERNISLSVSNISWMSINIKGSVATVEIKEKVKKPEISTNSAPCNIKAAADGVITDIKSSSGEIKVLKGSGVAKGDLLVSGILETNAETIEYVHAEAVVYADVISEKEFTLPDEIEYYSLTENKTDRSRLSFLCFEFPCTLSFEVFDNSVSEINSKNLFADDTVLPLGIKTETTYELIKQTAVIDEATAENYFKNEMLLYEIFEKPGSALVNRSQTISKDTNGYICNTVYTFNENIAQEAEFAVE